MVPAMAMRATVKNAQTGKPVEGELVKVIKAEEPSHYFELEDGTEVSMRVTLSRVIRVTGQQDEAGNPIYSFDVNVNTAINVPPDAKRRLRDA